MTIQIQHLTKKFYIREHYPGVLGAIKGLFCSKKREFAAIDDLTFSVESGERVAFIGPNGAGKSTTIKLLTGILYPTSGDIEVMGLVPWKARQALGYKIGTVFGQRSQLWYHLPPSDTFMLLSKIYEIDPIAYQKRLVFLTEAFGVIPLLNKTVSQLSLGERMRCEIVASVLHNPKILFLDEPTIGLDVNGKLMIRDMLNMLSKDHGTTLFLTSHDTADIEQVCDRVIVLDKGKIIIDSTLRNLKKTYMKKKVLSLVTNVESLTLNMPGLKILENHHHHYRCEADLEVVQIDHIIHEALKLTTLKDVTIEDPSMEEVIRLIYSQVRHV